MPLIDSVVPEKASGQVAEIYGDLAKVFGRVPNAMQMYSSSPALLAQQWQATGYYFTHPNLPRPLLAAIRMLVSQENDCDYCIGFNAGMLINMAGWTPEQVAASKRDASAVPLSEKEKALLHFVLKAVNRREVATRAEIDALTRLGWTHADLLDAVAHGHAMSVSISFSTPSRSRMILIGVPSGPRPDGTCFQSMTRERSLPMQADRELDCRGLNCPLPILRAKKSLAEIETGRVLKIIATDPGSLKDFQAFARQTGNDLLESVEASGEYTFYIRRK